MNTAAHDVERRVAELVGKLPTLPDTLDRLMNNLRHPAAADLADAS